MQFIELQNRFAHQLSEPFTCNIYPRSSIYNGHKIKRIVFSEKYYFLNLFILNKITTSVKKPFLFLLILGHFPFIMAQEELKLGVNIDLMASWLSPKTNLIDKDGTRPGIQGGLMAEYFFHPNYGLVTGLNIGIQGGSLQYENQESIKTGDNSVVQIIPGSTVAYSLSYLTLPVGLKLKTNEIGYLTYFAQLGFNQRINMGSRASSTGNALKKDNVSEEINLLNLSYYFGGGIEYGLGGQTTLVAGLFFNNGYVDVLSNNNHKAVLNHIIIRVGVLF